MKTGVPPNVQIVLNFTPGSFAENEEWLGWAVSELAKTVKSFEEGRFPEQDCGPQPDLLKPGLTDSSD